MAGTAPPVMLMICRLAWGPSVKREKGIEIEMPCCRIKFELNNRKKTSRNARSTSDTSTSQPKLKFIVRLSFMRLLQVCRFSGIACLGIKLRFRSNGLFRLEADDATDGATLS